MKIGLGCDHGGYNLKLEIKKYLGTKGILEQIMIQNQLIIQSTGKK